MVYGKFFPHNSRYALVVFLSFEASFLKISTVILGIVSIGAFIQKPCLRISVHS